MTKLLSIREASEMLAVKPATIRAWLLRRRLPRVNCGRAVRIPAEAVERFIDRNTVPAKEEPKQEQEGLEAHANSNDCKRPTLIRVPQAHHAPNEFGDLPDELPDASVGWTENPEQAQ